MDVKNYCNMEKINLVEILKDCPIGMELDCTIYEDVILNKIDNSPEREYPIQIKTRKGYLLDLTKYGTYTDIEESKCVIFPKGKITWEGFQRPFKDGDIIYTHTDALKCNLHSTFISIFEECSDGKCRIYAGYSINTNSFYSQHSCNMDDIIEQRLATEEEKAKLFQAIKDNGYKWNPENKTLEKLSKFKVGDRVRLKLKPNYVYTIHSLAWDDNKKLAYRLLPNNDKHLILVSLNAQNDYELVPNKFDITTLKPFDKVLVRDYDDGM